jgi:phosphoglycerate dehydrogenase-like enzyme
MKYALFLQDLDLSREDTRRLLSEATGDNYEAIWPGDPALALLANDVEVLVTAEHKVDSSELEPWPNLRMVSLAFTGYDQVDTAYCSSRDPEIKLYYVPDYSSDSVAELTVGLALAVLRKIPRADRNTRTGVWHGDGIKPGTELHGKRVGILGIGNIGTKSAKLFQAFGCAVTGWARNSRPDLDALGCKFEPDLSLVIADSDIIVLHLPVDRSATQSTRHIISKDRLRLMRPSSILINTARSELVDAAALVEALREHRIMGAGIDVFDAEPVAATDALLSLDNVVLTPHIGFKTKEALGRLADIAIANIGRFLRHDSENLLQ